MANIIFRQQLQNGDYIYKLQLWTSTSTFLVFRNRVQVTSLAQGLRGGGTATLEGNFNGSGNGYFQTIPAGMTFQHFLGAQEFNCYPGIPDGAPGPGGRGGNLV